MFERPKSGETAVLVHMDMDTRTDPDELAEFQDLVRSAGAMSAGLIRGSRKTLIPNSIWALVKLLKSKHWSNRPVLIW